MRDEYRIRVERLGADGKWRPMDDDSERIPTVTTAEAMDELERQDQRIAERQDELDRARAPMPIVEPPEDNWREDLHTRWIEADRLAEARVRAAETGYLERRGR